MSVPSKGITSFWWETWGNGNEDVMLILRQHHGRTWESNLLQVVLHHWLLIDKPWSQNPVQSLMASDSLATTSHSINIRVQLYVEIIMLSSIDAWIIAITLQALLTGVYFASFLLCLRWFIFSDDGGTLRNSKTVHWPFLIITLILFAFLVTDLGLSLQITLLASQGASITSPRICNRIITVSHPRIELLMGWTAQKIIEMLVPIITDSVMVCEWARLIVTGYSWNRARYSVVGRFTKDHG